MNSVIAAVLVVATAASDANAEMEGFSFPGGSGFRVERIAGNEQAPNIHSMTIDGNGHVVVSGPGYVRRLLDLDGDGFLETARDIFPGPERGCHGLLFADNALYFVGGGGLHRLDLDEADERIASREPRLIVPIGTGGEHNAHAVRRGADNFLYLISGNGNRVRQESLRGGFSPVRDPYAGFLLRLPTSGKFVEVLAHGMRNAYDFDFLPGGDIIAWDSDGERDEGLPWYRPCRLYHLTPGADCGWRSSGSGKVPTSAIDTIAPAAEIGRGSPTGVTCYQHVSFPRRYRGGIFALDWTFGRVLFFSPRETAGTYGDGWEEFLTCSTSTPFAPCDVEITPDGSLIVASGGRGLSGAVYRVSFPRDGDRDGVATANATTDTPIDRVLHAPMPLAEWSRRRWTRELSPGVLAGLETVLVSKSRTPREKVRALDVLMDFTPAAKSKTFALVHGLGEKAPPALRARTAWWIGVRGSSNDLKPFLRDDHPRVARVAVESASRFFNSDPSSRTTLESILALARRPERRLRQAVAYTLAHLSAAELPAPQTAEDTLIRDVALVLGARRGIFLEEPASDALAALGKHGTVTPGTPPGTLATDFLRLVEITFEHLQPTRNPQDQFYEGWEAVDLAPHRALRDTLAPLLTTLAPSSTAAARLCGLLRIESDRTPGAILERIDATSPPGDDVLTLSFLMRLEAPWSDDIEHRVASAFLDLPLKVGRLGTGRDGRWHRFVGQIWEAIIAHHPGVIDCLLDEPRFGLPDHTQLARALPGKKRQRAVGIFERRPLPVDPTGRRLVVDLLAVRPSPASREILRSLRHEPALRNIVIAGLARTPVGEDRDVFREILAADDRTQVAAAVGGLLALPVPPPDDSGRGAVCVDLFRWGLVLDGDPSLHGVRDLVARLFARHTGFDGGYTEGVKASQHDAIARWSGHLIRERPSLRKQIEATLAAIGSDEKRLEEVLARARWERGDTTRGAGVFKKFQCNVCHSIRGSGSRLGPDLGGIGKRFSRKEVVEAIVLPNRAVAERYRAVTFILASGERLDGRPVYDSRAAVLVVTPGAQLRRISHGDILARISQSYSLMPTGLIDGMTIGETEDLVAFLRSE